MTGAPARRIVLLLRDAPMTGRENMARDEDLLARELAAVRLYAWRPACVSLGRAQRPDVVDLDLARAWGVDVVERATGGGAILHTESEVTYAVALPLDFPGLPRDVTGSFVFVSQGVVAALRALGLDAALETDPAGTREDLCYVRKQGTNVLVGGRKISGGAQRRTARFLLQHGTVIVDAEHARMARLLRTPEDVVRARVTSLADEGLSVSRGKLSDALVAGFEEALGVRLEARASF